MVGLDNKHCLGTWEHVENENMSDKTRLSYALMHMTKVEHDMLIHDGLCHYAAYIIRRHYWMCTHVKCCVVGALRTCNHACNQRQWQ